MFDSAIGIYCQVSEISFSTKALESIFPYLLPASLFLENKNSLQASPGLPSLYSILHTFVRLDFLKHIPEHIPQPQNCQGSNENVIKGNNPPWMQKLLQDRLQGIRPIPFDLLIKRILPASWYNEEGSILHLHKRLFLKIEPEPNQTSKWNLQFMRNTEDRGTS